MLPDVNHAENCEDKEDPPGSEQENHLSQDQEKLRSGRSVFTEQLCELSPRQGRKAVTNPQEEDACREYPHTKHQAVPQGPSPIVVSGIRCVVIFLLHTALFFLSRFLGPVALSASLHCTYSPHLCPLIPC